MSPSRRDPEIVAEQAYLDAVYERLEAMRVSASSVADAYNDVRRGGTHQARLERDIAVETTHRRLASIQCAPTSLAAPRTHSRRARARRAAGAEQRSRGSLCCSAGGARRSVVVGGGF